MVQQTGAKAAPTDARLGRIVRLLSDNPMVVVSGTRIAEEIGVSRSEVWRLMEQLRELGVAIVGHMLTGYRLESIPDLVLPEALRPRLAGTIFDHHIHHFFRLDSTSTAAMEAAGEGAPEGSVFLAEQQTAGRGRGANTWESEASVGLYLSVVLRPPLPPTEVIILALAAGLAVHAAVRDVTGQECDLRWPNDAMLGGRKFCGILTELNAEITRVRYAVVGIGINVNQTAFPPELQEVATSLRMESGRTWPRSELAAALLRALDREYQQLVQDNAAAHESILRRFEQASSFARGRRVQVPENGGFEGVTEGLDERGFLKVRSAQGLRTVLSGGVRALEDGNRS